jgi:hypothetical protein
MAWRSDDQNLRDKRIAPIVNVRWKLFLAVVMTTAFVLGAGSAFAASPRKYDCVGKRLAATHPELCATPKASSSPTSRKPRLKLNANQENTEMKNLLLATVAVLAIAGPAMAFTNQRPATELNDGPTSLTCHPEHMDHSDRDPVVRTYISIDLDGSNDFAAKSFTVRHELLNGRIIDRDDQYTGRLHKDRGIAQWYWTGTLDRNPSVQMKATLFHNSIRGWRYQETVFKNGYVEKTIPEEDCSINQGD